MKLQENYDDFDEIEQQEQQSSTAQKVKSGIRFARVVLLLIMVIAALVLLFSNKDKINSDNFKRLFAKIDIGVPDAKVSDNTAISFDYDASSVIGVYKDGIARVTSNELSVIDNVGNKFQSVITGFNTPALITTNKFIVAFDRGGKKLIIANSFTVLFEKTFEDNIVDVSMNDNGYFCVITESEAYKNKLVVFDSSFKEIYKINSLNRYFVTADISEDNKHIAVSAVYAKNENVIPQICYYKVTSEEEMWAIDYTEVPAVKVVSKNDGSVCALFEWGVAVINHKGAEKYRFEFENKILQSFAFDDGKSNVVVLSESASGNSEIYVFDNSGKKSADILADYTALSVDILSDRIAVSSIDKLLIYSTNGKLVDERENTSDASHILFSDKNSFLGVNSSGVVYNIID